MLNRRIISAFAFLLVLASWTTAEVVTMQPFSLPDTNNAKIAVAAGQADLTVVCFMGTECPMAKLYAKRLTKLAGEYKQKSKDVRFVAISSNSQDSMEDVVAYVEKHQLGFPMLKDYRNTVADQFGAKRTPEVFLLDKQLEVKYHGRIDDQYEPGIARAKPTKEDLKIAIDECLAGKAVTHPEREATGCLIGRVREPVASSDVTYCKQVTRIFQKHCIECHRDGEIGPFSLTEYDEATGWADMILEVIDNGRMPPWHASPDHGKFVNAREMPQADRDTLAKWVENGMPYGDPEELPEKVEFTKGWRLPREPDLVLEMNEEPFVVPADGTVEYQYFVVDPGFEEDKWINGAQVLPGNHSVVHHSIVFIRPPDGSQFRGIGWLSAYVPGQTSPEFAPGYAIRVPAKSKLVFQQHYTPTGTEQADKTRIGLLFCDESTVTREMYSIVGIEQEFEIPPHAEKHEVKEDVRYFPDNAELLAISPHMHLRGKSFSLASVAKDNSTTLLDVPEYDFNWQHSYILSDPLQLDTVDRLDFTATFDNSEKNPTNPDPTQYVTWGDQTWEEMSVVFLEISVPRYPDDKKPKRKKQGKKSEDEISADTMTKMEAEADRIISRFDKNGDGVVTEYETPFVFRQYQFRRIDKDRDGKLTREEIKKQARWRVQ
ncbi:MAG: redoxin domain-containing protein [Planctomycetota bacterium]